MRSAFLSPKEYRDFAAQCLRWAARAKREEHKNMMLQMADHWMQTARRRPRKTTLGKSRRRTISRVRIVPDSSCRQLVLDDDALAKTRAA